MAGCERWHVRYLVSFVESELRTATATMPPFAITECRWRVLAGSVTFYARRAWCARGSSCRTPCRPA